MNYNRLTAKLRKIGLTAMASAVVLACGGNAFCSPPNPADYKSLGQFLSALKKSTDPQAVDLVKQIAEGPTALAAEREGFP